MRPDRSGRLEAIVNARSGLPLAPSAPLSRRGFVSLALGASLAIVAPRSAALALEASAPYTYTVCIAKGYLALRSFPSYDASNELGALYTGDIVQVQEPSTATYWWVYVPRLGMSGFVNAGCLSGSDYVFTVNVAKGYLALRNAKTYDEHNEIGALCTGDNVWVRDASDPVYWLVYAPRLGLSGYVNHNYLVGGEVACPTRVVQVAKGYLALRTEPAYDASNEIAPLNTGDTVQVRATGSGDYCYVYSPRWQCSGYVNANYLVDLASYEGSGAYTVSVERGYLALRCETAYDASNELGALYNGDVVYYQSAADDGYWFVYAPSLDSYGYVNAKYLR